MSPPKGISILLQSLGINAEEIQKTIGGFGQIIVSMNNSQQRTENMMRAIYEAKFPDTDPAGIRNPPAPGNAGDGGPQSE